jgi:hypothetical protein
MSMYQLPAFKASLKAKGPKEMDKISLFVDEIDAAVTGKVIYPTNSIPSRSLTNKFQGFSSDMHALRGWSQAYFFTGTISPGLTKGLESLKYNPTVMTVENHSTEAGK